MKQIEAGLGKQLGNAETTFEAMKRRDSDLRKKLEEEFSDDPQFTQLIREMESHLGKASAPHAVGIERARALAAAEAVMKKVLMTERGRLSGEFVRTSKAREAAEAEVRALQRDVEKR